MSMQIIPKRIVNITPGPEIEGMQALVTVELELPDHLKGDFNAETLEIVLPEYLFLRAGKRRQ